MPIKLKVFIQMLQKSQNRHKISFAFEFDNKNIKKYSGKSAPTKKPNYKDFFGVFIIKFKSKTNFMPIL